MDKTEYKIEVDGKDYTIVSTNDGKYHNGHIPEVDIFFCAEDYDDLINTGKAMIKIHNKHMAIPGMKNFRTWQVGFDFRLTILSPYLSKSWFFHFHRSKSIRHFSIRLFGFQFAFWEPNAKDKLNKILTEKYKNR